MSLWFPPAKELHQHRLLHRLPRSLNASRSRSGMLLLFGLGILWWTTVLFAGTISWICVLSVRLIKLAPPVKSAPLLGVCAIMLSISTASAVGSKLVKCAL